jgi:murein DD-endopeptidase MepM/ murein hydrolase activator NlpD
MDTLNVTEGQNVRAGQLLGQQGNTGSTSGAGGGYHCHFVVLIDGVPSNPHTWCETWQ